MKKLLATILIAAMIVCSVPVSVNAEELAESIEVQEIEAEEVECVYDKASEETIDEDELSEATIEAEDEEKFVETDNELVVQAEYDEFWLEQNGASNIKGTIAFIEETATSKSKIGSMGIVQCVRFTPEKSIVDETINAKLTIKCPTKSQEIVEESEFNLQKVDGKDYFEGSCCLYGYSINPQTEYTMVVSVGENTIEKNITTIKVETTASILAIGHGYCRINFTFNEKEIQNISDSRIVVFAFYEGDVFHKSFQGTLKNGQVTLLGKGLKASTKYKLKMSLFGRPVFGEYSITTAADNRKVKVNKVSVGGELATLNLTTANFDEDSSYSEPYPTVFVKEKASKTYERIKLLRAINESNLVNTDYIFHEFGDGKVLSKDTEYDYVIADSDIDEVTINAGKKIYAKGSFTTKVSGDYKVKRITVNNDYLIEQVEKISDQEYVVENKNNGKIYLETVGYDFKDINSYSMVTITSSDASVLSIDDEKGSFTAKKAGEVEITLKASDVYLWQTGIESKKIKIIVKDIPEDLTLKENYLVNRKKKLQDIKLPDGYVWANPAMALKTSGVNKEDALVYDAKYIGSEFMKSEVKASVRLGVIKGLTIEEKITNLDHKNVLRTTNDSIYLKIDVSTAGIVDNSSYRVEIPEVKGLKLVQKDGGYIVTAEKKGNYTVKANLILKDEVKPLFTASYKIQVTDKPFTGNETTVRLKKSQINLNLAYAYDQIYEGVNETQLIEATVPEGKSIESVSIDNINFTGKIYANQILICPKNNGIKKGNYKINLTLKVSGKDEKFPITIKVYEKNPTIIVKQIKELNLMLNEGNFGFGAKTTTKGTKVSYAYWNHDCDEDVFDYICRSYTTADGYKYVEMSYTNSEALMQSNKKTLQQKYVNGKIVAYVYGYLNRYEKKVSIKSVYKAPTIASATGDIVIDKVFDGSKATISLVNKDSGSDITIDKSKDTVEITGVDATATVNSDSTITIIYTGNKKTSYVDIKYKSSNWKESAKARVKIRVSNPNLELSNSKFTAIAVDDDEDNQKGLTLYIKHNGKMISNVNIEAIAENAETKKMIEQGIFKINDSYKDSPSININVKKYLRYGKKGGSYKFKIKVDLLDEASDAVTYTTYLPFSFEMKKNRDVTVGGISNIKNGMSLNNYRTTPYFIYTQSFTGVSGSQYIKAVKLSGSYSNYFQIGECYFSYNAQKQQMDVTVNVKMTPEGKKIFDSGEKFSFKVYFSGSNLGTNSKYLGKTISFKTY